MKIYIWRGDRVLKNYGTGIVVITAENKEQAWQKLKAEDIETYSRLLIGVTAWDILTFEEMLNHPDDYYWAWKPEDAPQPTEYTMETLPILIISGSL